MAGGEEDMAVIVLKNDRDCRMTEKRPVRDGCQRVESDGPTGRGE